MYEFNKRGDSHPWGQSLLRYQIKVQIGKSGSRLHVQNNFQEGLQDRNQRFFQKPCDITGSAAPAELVGFRFSKAGVCDGRPSEANAVRSIHTPLRLRLWGLSVGFAEYDITLKITASSVTKSSFSHLQSHRACLQSVLEVQDANCAQSWCAITHLPSRLQGTKCFDFAATLFDGEVARHGVSSPVAHPERPCDDKDLTLTCILQNLQRRDAVQASTGVAPVNGDARESAVARPGADASQERLHRPGRPRLCSPGAVRGLARGSAQPDPFAPGSFVQQSPDCVLFRVLVTDSRILRGELCATVLLCV